MKVTPKGNERIRGVLHSYIEKIQQTGKIPVPFLMLSGPSGLGKISVAQDLAKKLLGDFYYNDTLILHDYTRVVEKPHTIKISSDDRITLPDGTLYEDLWIREVHEWISKSPAGKYKCLIIEDIERLTESAANALLKILEEPLAWRIIIATCSNQADVLPTILSRALLFSFYSVADEVMDTYIFEEPALQWFDRGFLYAIASGRVGILEELIEKPDVMQILQKWYTELVHSYPIALQALADAQTQTSADKIHMPKKTPFEVYKAILPIIELWYEKTLLQAYIFYAAKQQSWDSIQITQEALRMANYAIKKEHIMYDFLMRLDEYCRS